MLNLLAQAQDISSVSPDFVKSFMIMLAFVTTLGGGVYFGRRGSQGSPMHVAQPIGITATVTPAPVYAQQSALDAVKSDIERRTRENLRQHEENSKHLATALEAGNERLQSMLTALHDMETRMTKATLSEIRSLHERINPLGEMAASHKSEIKGLNDRIQHLWEMIQSLWTQVFAKPAPRK